MSYTIIAIDVIDGWAIVQSDEKVFMTRPPHDSSNQYPVTLDDAERAIGLEGFTRCKHELDDMAAVIAFIKAAFVQDKRDRGIKLSPRRTIKLPTKRSIFH